jgi:peptidoglycan hydrolase CwlO-like protein
MKILRYLVLFFLVVIASSTVYAQSQSDIENRIADLERTVTDLQSQQKTLANQINIFNSQISLTTLRINSSKGAIAKLSSEIGELNDEIDRLEILKTKRLELVLHRIPEAYKRNQVSQFGVIFFSQNVSDFLSRVKYLSRVQQEDTLLYKQLQNTQDTYGERKDLREKKKEQSETLKAQLESQNIQLEQQKQVKDTLLRETQGKETVYQQLLSQAKAQLAGFGSFVSNQGGASILSNQTVCDDWGCYYNQRDSQWGNIALNHTQYSIASDGCLLTSMAMVYTHLGRKSVNPATINANPQNFASYYPAFLNKTIIADGMTTSRVASSIDSELNAGRPVIVKIVYSNGDTHFVVLISGSNGNYIMNDPFVPNGHKIPFRDYYSLGSVREIEKIMQ